MIKKLNNFLTVNKKNIAKISSGTIVGQAITLATLPIITRLYGAEILGVWAFLASISLIVKSFSDLGMTQSIMVEEGRDAKKIYKVINTISLGISFIISPLIVLCYFIFSDIDINFMFFTLIVFLLVLTTQQIQICYTWLNKNSEYSILMKNPVIHNSIYSILAIIFGLIGWGIYGFLLANILGQVFTLLHMKRKLPQETFTYKVKDFSYILKRNKRYVIYQTPTNILSNIKNQLPILLIQFFWGAEILGYYSITVKVLQIPSTFLANAIGRVFFQIVSEKKRSGKSIGKSVVKNILMGMKISAVPIIILMSFGEVITVFFLGEEWAISGHFIQILAVQYYFMFITNTVQGLSTILQKQNYAMISSSFQVAGFITGALIGKIYFNDIYIALILMSTLFIIIHIIYFGYLFKSMNVSSKKYVLYSLISIFFIIIISFLLNLLFLDSSNFSLFNHLLLYF